MKRFYGILFLVLFVLASNSLFSLINWEKTEGPFGGSVDQIIKLLNGKLISVTNGSVYQSTNNGQNWSNLWISSFKPLRLYPEINGNIFATSYWNEQNKNEVFVSSGDLSVWQKKSKGLENRTINKIVFKDNLQIFACTDTGVYKSTDNGDNWSQCYVIPNVNNWMMNLAFNTSGTIFMGTIGGLYISNDNGSSWLLCNDSAKQMNSNIENILIVNDDTMFITIPFGIYRSFDKGITWTHLTEGIISSNVGFLEFTQDGKLLAGFEWMGLYESTDFGDTWKNIYSSAGSNIIFSGASVFISSLDGVLYADSLTGNWTYRNQGINELSIKSIIINKLNNQHYGEIFIGDERSRIYKSTDNGNSWKFLFKTNGASVSDFVIGKQGDIFAATIWGGIYHSSDDGENWNQSSTGLNDPDVRDIAIDSSGNIFAGTFSEVYKSTNNGGSWSVCLTQNQSVQCSTLVVNKKGYIFAGTIVYGALRSTNGGTSWTQVANGMNFGVYYLTLNKNDVLYAVTASGDLYKSTNDGNNWLLVKSGMGFNKIFFLSNDDIIASVDQDHSVIGLFHSTDGGQNWLTDSTGMVGCIPSGFDMNSEGYIYVVSNGGVHHSQSPVTSVEEINTEIQDISIYPNPANDYINISLPNENGLPVSLVIYDLLGNKVLEYLVNNNLPTLGNININTEKLNQGQYSLLIKLGDKVFTKSLIIIK
jgi:photosystem II stability/assembly factor-like uncharacterized protein